jgi:hypothetical protein
MSNNVKTKYRLIVTKQSQYGSWSDVLWEGKDKWDPELEKKYCFWMSKKGSNKPIKEEREINGSKLEINVEVLDANVQISCGKNGFGMRKWSDYDFKAPLDKLKISMR